MSPFKLLEHTADIGIAVWGEDLAALFRDAAAGLFAVIHDGAMEGWPAAHTVRLEAPDAESLLVDWLSELLYLFEVKHFFFTDVEFETIEPTSLTARCKGTQFKTMTIGTEVKAVTHHLLRIDRTARGFEANLYFDL